MNLSSLLSSLFGRPEMFGGKLRRLTLVALGILSAGLGLEGFVLPSGFLDGGVTGISLLIHRLSGWPLPLLIVIINLPFMFLAYRQVNPAFAIKTMLAIGGLALCLVFVPFPVVTQDKLLVSVFGGFFLGLGIGLCIRGGCVIDGTEVLAISVGKKSGLSIGDVILMVNILIFSVAAFLFNLETALYSLLTYFAASKSVDFVVHGIEEYTGVTIVSEKSDEIRAMIIDTMGRGVTILVGKGGYGKKGQSGEIDVLYTVITRLEIARLKSEIAVIDPQAFVVMQSVNDTKGGMVKKRPLEA